jgi:hypothetical protein
VLYGFALMTLDEDPEVEVHVTGDRNDQHEETAKKLHRALRRTRSVSVADGTAGIG